MTESLGNILVVDDDVDSCSNVRDILSDLGFRLDTAHSGKDALTLVRQRQYDVALLDFNMPGMDGAALYREIKRLHPSTVAIIVTAQPCSETLKAAEEAGAWRILSKPVEFQSLIPLINQAIQQPCALIVDDDEDLCDELWRTMRQSGFRVCRAQNTQQVRETVSSACCRFVLVDMDIGQRDTTRILSMIRELHACDATVVVAASRDDVRSNESELQQLGADAIYAKPIDIGQLRQTISETTE